MGRLGSAIGQGLPLGTYFVSCLLYAHVTSSHRHGMDSLKRKRSRRACTPCRERKRKCDGNEPCTTCTDWGYKCLYEAAPTRRDARQRQQQYQQQQQTLLHGGTGTGTGSVPPATPRSSSISTPVPAARPVESTAEHEIRGAVVRRLEANSGAAFVRKLGLKIDPSRAPKLNLFGWNIGARQLTSSSSRDAVASLPVLSIVDITSHEHMRSLAQVYFDQVDPCYGFVDRDHFFQRLASRWTTSSSSSSPASAAPASSSADDDSILAGVAALGCAFSQHHATVTELHLVRAAQASLANTTHHLSGPPSLALLTGWTLRTVYLRITDSPHATWIASCTLMHLVEASGLLHTEAGASSLSPLIIMPKPNNVQQQCSSTPDGVRRLVGVAHHLNAWTSFDLGLRRVAVELPGLPAAAAAREGDYTAEVLSLLPVSISLDPDNNSSSSSGGGSKQHNDDTDLAATLAGVLAGSHTRPPSVMAQCNLVLCILRRMHTHNNLDLDLAPGLGARVLALLGRGLDCARTMVRGYHPWHQAANVPFNMICVLLTMDTRASLAMVPEAMQTLSLVASVYDTETMREAYSTACLLVLLHQQRRRDDINVLSDALNGSGSVHQQGPVAAPMSHLSPSEEDYSWLGDLVADMPGLQRVDFDQFLNADLISDPCFWGGQIQCE